MTTMPMSIQVMTEDPTDGLDTDCDGVSDPGFYAVTEEYVDELCLVNVIVLPSLSTVTVKHTLYMNTTMKSGTTTA